MTSSTRGRRKYWWSLPHTTSCACCTICRLNGRALRSLVNSEGLRQGAAPCTVHRATCNVLRAGCHVHCATCFVPVPRALCTLSTLHGHQCTLHRHPARCTGTLHVARAPM